MWLMRNVAQDAGSVPILHVGLVGKWKKLNYNHRLKPESVEFGASFAFVKIYKPTAAAFVALIFPHRLDPLLQTKAMSGIGYGYLI